MPAPVQDFFHQQYLFLGCELLLLVSGRVAIKHLFLAKRPQNLGNSSIYTLNVGFLRLKGHFYLVFSEKNILERVLTVLHAAYILAVSTTKMC